MMTEETGDKSGYFRPQKEPSMEEFTVFHGMVCSPRSSQKCIHYFDGGALFASQDEYKQEDLSIFDYTRTPIRLNLFSYYALVVISGTGLLSILGQTKAPLIREEQTVLTVEGGRVDGEKGVLQSKSLKHISNLESLTIPYKVLHYILERSECRDYSTEKIRVLRRFEYEFGNLLSVIMVHFDCAGRKYLVEVYEFHHGNNPITRIISYLMRGLQSVCFSLSRAVRPNQKSKAT